MTIISSAFQPNAPIPTEYACDGKNINPPLELRGIPEDTKSLALIMDDPDAPHGTWVHWVLWNIDPKITHIEVDSVPIGAVEGQTSFGEPGYGGPCPPLGTHRYFFKIYALDIKPNLSAESDKDSLEDAMESHILAEAELVGTYVRKK